MSAKPNQNTEPKCSENSDNQCSKPGGRISLGLCNTHYIRRQKPSRTLVFNPECIDNADGQCTEPVGKIKALGLCSKHYDRRRTAGTLPKSTKMMTSAEAWAAFKAAAEAQGGTVLEPNWLGDGKPHACRCAKGHTFSTSPTNVKQRGFGCITCAGQDPAIGKANFYAKVEAQGGTVIGEYVNTNTPVDCICKFGHPCSPLPCNLYKENRGLCKTCAICDPAVAKANFWAAVEAVRGRVVGEYFNCDTKVDCVCEFGHPCNPKPNSVQQGGGICATCAGQIHTVFYITTGPRGLKLGVGSREGKPRLDQHRRDGYYGPGDPDRLWTELPGRVADDTEDLILVMLKNRGHKPIRGHEYFGIELLPVMLGIVDRVLAPYTPVYGPGQMDGVSAAA